MIIALDIDEVLADFATPVHEAAERILGRYLPEPASWPAYDLNEAMSLSLEEANLLHTTLCEEDDLGFKIDLFPGAQEFVLELFGQGHDVFFVTAPWPGIRSWVWARTNLLDHYFGDCFETVFTNAKHRVVADVLVDDRPETLISNARRAIVWDKPWNRHIVASPRGRSYSELLEIINK